MIASETGKETQTGRLGAVYVGVLWNLRVWRCSCCHETELYVFSFISGFVLMGRIEDWALIQAKLRMEEEGINLDYKVD